MHVYNNSMQRNVQRDTPRNNISKSEYSIRPQCSLIWRDNVRYFDVIIFNIQY